MMPGSKKLGLSQLAGTLVYNLGIQLRYLFHDLRRLLFPGLLIGLVIPILMFILVIPPLIPILPEGMWWSGTLKIGYLSWICLWSGFALQKREEKDPGLGKEESKEPFMGTTLLSILLLVVGLLVALALGLEWWIVLLILPIQLAVLLVHNFGNLGRDGILPLTHIFLLIWGFWFQVLAETSQAPFVESWIRQLFSGR